MVLNNYLNYFIPQSLESVQSPINSQIKVINFMGKPRIMVNGLIQSGGMVETIWRKGLNSIQHPATSIKDVLILGLGGGTAAKLISEKFPKAKITGIEIDPIMIKLGKKYFELDKIENLKIINKDAIEFINHHSPITNHYSLALVDLYLGDKIPKQSESEIFLKNLKKLLAKDGIVIFNRLFYGKHRKNTEEFIGRLEAVFNDIQLVRAWSNLLVGCK